MKIGKTAKRGKEGDASNLSTEEEQKIRNSIFFISNLHFFFKADKQTIKAYFNF